MSLKALLAAIQCEPVIQSLLDDPETDRSICIPGALRRLLAAALSQKLFPACSKNIAEGEFPQHTSLGLNRQQAPKASGFKASQAGLRRGASSKKTPLLVYVTASERGAETAQLELDSYLPSVARFPAWETLPHERVSPRPDTMAQRIAILRRLKHPDPNFAPACPIQVLVVPIRALLQPVAANLAEISPLALHLGSVTSPQKVVQRLGELGYERSDLVSGRGQFAQRGCIVDVFVPGEAHPQRIEFFGDEVDEIRSFSLTDQRTIAPLQQVWAPACKELLLTSENRKRAGQLQKYLPGAAEMLELISEGIPVEGMESLLPFLRDDLVSLTEFFPSQSVILFDEPELLKRQAQDLLQLAAEFEHAAWQAAAEGSPTPIRSKNAFQSYDEVQKQCQEQDFSRWELTSLPQADATAETPPTQDRGTSVLLAPEQPATSFDTHAAVGGVAAPASSLLPSSGGEGIAQVKVAGEPARSYHGDIPAAVRSFKDYLHAGWKIILVCEGSGTAKRFAQNLEQAGVRTSASSQLDQPEQILVGLVNVASGVLSSGFSLPEAHLLVVSEKELTGRAVNYRSQPTKLPSRRRKKAIDPLSLKAGDFVVHNQHGVGRFVQMLQRQIGKGPNAASREYLVLEYAPSKRGHPGDRLYVPTDALDQISRYAGSDTPALNKMGGADWAKTKQKARKATKQIAAELIRLYAARQATKGYAFGPDTPWQRDLEDAFIYNETPDQLLTIDEVKADMQRGVPMDRLLCGDVGYGKTEVAVRAAFKAIQDGKQVAVLVPTTLLVKQHFETFSGRYSAFPVRIGQLSRFASTKEAQQVKAGLKSGDIDLVIGTHTLLSGEVGFKDLGLVIIDEEQRFGVEHKETLKALRTNVDVLAMSATPIPRTLEMAVTGIREMSTLSTPPEERHPVLTFVGPRRSEQIKAAIKRELLRQGQVFFIHNRVDTIDRVALELRNLVPEARVAVAHGQMGEKRLEQVMVDFWNHDFDVLVCTTIVETGLDIVNANTLIVDGAHRMGLSQLHQLRGRVGRSRERAYAYFFYPEDRPLTETALERLKTIAAHSDLGAGTAVAQKDLEIRGAGNLLGGEQSGHIAGVGFDLYVRMVAEAVEEFRSSSAGKKPPTSEEIKVELPVNANIPEAYIESQRLRLEIYQKLSAASSPVELDEIREELLDRYGPIPPPAQLLFSLASLRLQAREMGIKEIVAQGKYLRFGPLELAESQILRLKRLHRGSVIKVALRQVLVPVPTGKRLGEGAPADQELIDWITGLMRHIFTPFS